MNRLNPRERKLVALGLLVLVLALAWLGIGAPLLQGFADRRAEREALTDRFRHDARLIADFPSLRARAAAQGRDAGAYAFPTGSAGVARSAAEARLAAAVTTAGGQLQAVRDQPARPGQVRLRVDAALTLPALDGLLRALQDSRPYPTLDAMVVASDGTATAQRLSPLEVRLDVIYAYAAPLS